MWNIWILVIYSTLLCLCRSSAIEVDYDPKALTSMGNMWPDLIQKVKDGGLDAVETYIFWNAHEPIRRQYNFEGNLDFVKFFKLVQEAGLYGILRLGPYVCAEWNYGGFPVWLNNIEGIELRTDNEIYKNEMRIFVTKIVDMCKEAELFASQGGPIILAQIENEYGNIMWAYKDKGVAYVNWCAEMAAAQNIGVPWIICQQQSAPPPIVTFAAFFYSFFVIGFIMVNDVFFYRLAHAMDPHRPAEDLAYSVAHFFQAGGVLINYYMYHGGTNFGHTSGGPFITTSYDYDYNNLHASDPIETTYDAPLDEFGNLNQPKYGHLKQLHAAIKVGERVLTNGTATTKVYGNGVELTTYTNSITGESFCFLSNNNQIEEATVVLEEGNIFVVPAWSVSILGGCNKEIFNTAKVNTQTSIMVKKQMDDETAKLSWMWTLETIKDTLLGQGIFTARQLLEQKRVTSDVSDYLWYMASFDVNGTSWKDASSGQVLYAYVNGHLIGSQSGYAFQFKNPVSLMPGTNNLTLLSVTVGLQNYGQFFDKGPEGLNGGPVVLTDNKNVTIDLSSNTWKYKIGLNDEAERLHDPKSPHARLQFSSEFLELFIGMPMTEFKAPPGTDPVVVDLQGMGKGHAWINGNSIGRFWPARITDSNGCGTECDYRGKYNERKCLSNCGNPSQRWYHVPRSFLNDDNNTLILFEEMGGNLRNEGNTLELSCQGGQTSQIKFASFGDPQGKCGSFQKGSCDADLSISYLEKECVGRKRCSIDVSDATFGSTECANFTKRLAVEAIC
ncbi:hypothetical protein ES288_A12G232800v1 [Gossypium darwinii]|uniref:Beta-galactosidase n=1 Tax=Gossypium darwinii TaxID=34276 RepID=A0A5D2EDN8_GOSDA|nr:hypothetical protein ES288_A12G232800v1 [Gossypium darwinii]